MIRLYTDGGVIQKNPSSIGGTWAFVAVDFLDQELWRRSGVITPQEMKTSTVTNNQTELLAVIYGLQRLMFATEKVTLLSDSQITLGRVFGNSPFNNIPKWMFELLQCEKSRLRYFQDFEYVLLAGHPTKSQLDKGIGKHEHPVSKWNVLCDNLCQKEAKKFLYTSNSFRLPKN